MKNISNYQVKDFLIIVLLISTYVIDNPPHKHILSAFSIIVLIYPAVLKPIVFGWLKIAHILSYIVPQILLASVFFLVVTPMGLLKKIFSSKEQNTNSNFIIRDKEYSKEDLAFPF